MSSSLHKHAIYHREQKGGGWEDGGREPGEHVASSSCVISFSAQDYLLVQSQIKCSVPGDKGSRVWTHDFHQNRCFCKQLWKHSGQNFVLVTHTEADFSFPFFFHFYIFSCIFPPFLCSRNRMWVPQMKNRCLKTSGTLSGYTI